MKNLRIDQLDGDTVVLAALPGHRDVLAILTPARLEPIASELSTLRGRRTRCVVATPDAPGGTGVGPSQETLGSSAPPTAPGPAPFDRRAAMQVPLVRQVLEHFPDAMLLDAREEAPPKAETGGPGDPETESAEDAES